MNFIPFKFYDRLYTIEIIVMKIHNEIIDT